MGQDGSVEFFEISKMFFQDGLQSQEIGLGTPEGLMDRGAKELSGGGFPPKEKQSAHGSALLGVPLIPLFFPYGSLIFRNRTRAEKMHEHPRTLKYIVLDKQDRCQLRMINFFSNISSKLLSVASHLSQKIGSFLK